MEEHEGKRNQGGHCPPVLLCSLSSGKYQNSVFLEAVKQSGLLWTVKDSQSGTCEAKRVALDGEG